MGKKKKSGVRLNSKASRSKKKFEPMKVSPSPVEKDKQLPMNP
ncbi:MAG: hypothetical protein ACIPMY_01190 [Rickettsia endosymbiont of Pentastiridius leporinus]